MNKQPRISNQFLNSTVQEITDNYVRQMEAGLTYLNTENLFAKLTARGLLVKEAAVEVFRAYVRYIRNMEVSKQVEMPEAIAVSCPNPFACESKPSQASNMSYDTCFSEPKTSEASNPNHDTCIGYREKCKASMTKLTDFIDSLGLGGEERLRGGVINENGQPISGVLPELACKEFEKEALDSVSGIFEEASPRSQEYTTNLMDEDPNLDESRLCEFTAAEMDQLLGDIRAIQENLSCIQKPEEYVIKELEQSKSIQTRRVQCRERIKALEMRMNENKSEPQRLLEEYKKSIAKCKEVASLIDPNNDLAAFEEHRQTIESHDRQLAALVRECQNICKVAAKEYHIPEKEAILNALDNLESTTEPGSEEKGEKMEELLRKFVALEQMESKDGPDSDDEGSDYDYDFDYEEDGDVENSDEEKNSEAAVHSNPAMEEGPEIECQIQEEDNSKTDADTKGTSIDVEKSTTAETNQNPETLRESDTTAVVNGRVNLCVTNERVSFSRTYI